MRPFKSRGERRFGVAAGEVGAFATGERGAKHPILPTIGRDLQPQAIAIGGVAAVTLRLSCPPRDQRADARLSESRARVDAATRLIRELEAFALEYFQLD